MEKLEKITKTEKKVNDRLSNIQSKASDKDKKTESNLSDINAELIELKLSNAVLRTEVKEARDEIKLIKDTNNYGTEFQKMPSQQILKDLENYKSESHILINSMLARLNDFETRTKNLPNKTLICPCMVKIQISSIATEYRPQLQ